MTDIQLAHLSFGGEGRDHNREHLVALREARIASDHHAGTAEARLQPAFQPRIGLLSRVRLAFAGGPAVASDACNCPA